MTRIETLRRMGLDWAADLIERLEADRVRLRAEVSRLRDLLNKNMKDEEGQ